MLNKIQIKKFIENRKIIKKQEDLILMRIQKILEIEMSLLGVFENYLWEWTIADDYGKEIKEIKIESLIQEEIGFFKIKLMADHRIDIEMKLIEQMIEKGYFKTIKTKWLYLPFIDKDILKKYNSFRKDTLMP